MNQKYESPVKVVIDFYNKFRSCAGLEPDYIPVENVYLDDTLSGQKPIVIEEPEDEAAWTATLTPSIEMTFAFDVCDNDEDIKAKLKCFQEQVLNNPARHWTSFDWRRGRNWLEVRSNLERSLVAVRRGQPYSAIASELNSVDSKANEAKLKSADREARRLFIHGEKLLKSCNNFDEFCTAATKALPRNI